MCTAEILAPMDRKYLSASLARVLSSARLEPVLVDWTRLVQISVGNCLRKISQKRKPGSSLAGTRLSITVKHWVGVLSPKPSMSMILEAFSLSKSAKVLVRQVGW